MRDTDRDLTSVIVLRTDSPVQSMADLRGKTVGVGAVDSPQATLLPLAHLRAAGLEPDRDFFVRRFDVGSACTATTSAANAMQRVRSYSGEVDAACMIDSNHLAFARDGTLPAGSTRVLAQTAPFDHCNMTVSPGAPTSLTQRFKDLLLGMSYGDPSVRPLLDLEGLKAWCDGRTSGYTPLEGAVDSAHFYDQQGTVTARDYRP